MVLSMPVGAVVQLTARIGVWTGRLLLELAVLVSGATEVSGILTLAVTSSCKTQPTERQTVERVAGDPHQTLPLLQVDQVLLLSAIPVRSGARGAPLPPLADIHTIPSIHLGHLQHEPFCTNRRKQRRPASAGH
jgi:hypothetical protein